MQLTRSYRGTGRTIADPPVLAELLGRLQGIGPGTMRAWGRMTAHQMLVHLAEAHDAVLGRRPWTTKPRDPSRFVKLLALRLPMPWVRNLRFGDDPAGVVLDPVSFPADRERAAATLGDIAKAAPGVFSSPHPIFGRMSRTEWQRWAFLHTDHHLRQFGR